MHHNYDDSLMTQPYWQSQNYFFMIREKVLYVSKYARCVCHGSTGIFWDMHTFLIRSTGFVVSFFYMLTNARRWRSRGRASKQALNSRRQVYILVWTIPNWTLLCFLYPYLCTKALKAVPTYVLNWDLRWQWWITVEKKTPLAVLPWNRDKLTQLILRPNRFLF